MSNLSYLNLTKEALEIRKLASLCTAVRTYCSQDTAFELMKIEEALQNLVNKLDESCKEAEDNILDEFIEKNIDDDICRNCCRTDPERLIKDRCRIAPLKCDDCFYSEWCDCGKKDKHSNWKYW